MDDEKLPSLRVYAYRRRVKEQEPYLGEHEEKVQLLQALIGNRWHTIDREIVPDHVLISLGCYGDTGGWQSKFSIFGEFGRDGIIR